jgi:hypothetical protein
LHQNAIALWFWGGVCYFSGGGFVFRGYCLVPACFSF